METPEELPKCNMLCLYLPCLYADDKGCSTSDPSGAICKKKNPDAKQLCQGSHLFFLHSLMKNNILTDGQKISPDIWKYQILNKK